MGIYVFYFVKLFDRVLRMKRLKICFLNRRYMVLLRINKEMFGKLIIFFLILDGDILYYMLFKFCN